MPPEISSAIYTAIAMLIAAGSVWVGSRIHYRRKLDAANAELKIAKQKTAAASIELDEAVRASDLKNLQIVQSQYEEQQKQIARLQAREAARDTTDQILKELVAHIGDLKTRTADDTSLRARQFASLGEQTQAQTDKSTDKVVDQLGLAVNMVNDNTKSLFELLVEEIKAMGARLEAAINTNKTDPDIIITALSADMKALTAKVETMRIEQAETVRVAVADALGKAINRPPDAVQTVNVNGPPIVPADTPKQEGT